MNKLLIIAGLTILYYVVLIWLDRKKRKAFKAKQQAIIAKTATLPIVEETIEPVNDLLGGTTNLVNVELPLEKKQELVSPNITELKVPMTEKSAANKKDDLVANLAATTDITSIREEETMAFINSLKK